MGSEGQQVESRVDSLPVASTSEPSPKRFLGNSGAGANGTTLTSGAGRPLPKRFVRQQVWHLLCGVRHAAAIVLVYQFTLAASATASMLDRYPI